MSEEIELKKCLRPSLDGRLSITNGQGGELSTS